MRAARSVRARSPVVARRAGPAMVRPDAGQRSRNDRAPDATTGSPAHGGVAPAQSLHEVRHHLAPRTDRSASERLSADRPGVPAADTRTAVRLRPVPPPGTLPGVARAAHR